MSCELTQDEWYLKFNKLRHLVAGVVAVFCCCCCFWGGLCRIVLNIATLMSVRLCCRILERMDEEVERVMSWSIVNGTSSFRVNFGPLTCVLFNLITPLYSTRHMPERVLWLAVLACVCTILPGLSWTFCDKCQYDGSTYLALLVPFLLTLTIFHGHSLSDGRNWKEWK